MRGRFRSLIGLDELSVHRRKWAKVCSTMEVAGNTMVNGTLRGDAAATMRPPFAWALDLRFDDRGPREMPRAESRRDMVMVVIERYEVYTSNFGFFLHPVIFRPGAKI